ncbi:MAG: hypothetical protein MJE63_00370, partial [Proteobacteria bacterium]|nr:hypothetical protein [Pseudomonadota bacterium]
KKKIIFAFLLIFVLIYLSFARRITEVETICNKLIETIEENLNDTNNLYQNIDIEKSHTSFLGPMILNSEYIKDILITGYLNRTAPSEKKVIAVIFLYIEQEGNHWTNYIDSFDFRLRIKDKELIKDNLQFNVKEISIKIGLICENKELTNFIFNRINSIDLESLINNKLLKNEYLKMKKININKILKYE